jgi:hypothetical protein
MPDSKETPKNLADSKAQLAEAAKIAEGVKSGALPAADALKIPDQIAAAQGMLGGLEGAAKDAVNKAAEAANALKDELAKKLPEPVTSAEGALKGLGQEVAAAGEPLKAIAASLPEMKVPLGAASKDLGALKKKTPSAATVKETVPKVQQKLAPPKDQIPKVASILETPKGVIEGLSGKLTDVLGGVKPLLDKPPLAQALKKAGTGDAIKEHLTAAEEKLPKVPPLIDAAIAKINEATAPLLEADKKLGELLSEAVALAPPPPNAALEGLQQEIKNAAAAVTQAADPVAAATVNLPSAMQKIEKAQVLATDAIAKGPEKIPPVELKQTMDQILQLIAEAQKEVTAPAGAMPDAETIATMQVAVASLSDGAVTTLPAAAAVAPLEQQAKAAELFGHAQAALETTPAQVAEAAPAIQQLAEMLPKISAPLAQALQAMNDALTPPQQDLAEIERQLLQAEAQMTDQTKQVDVAVKQIDDTRVKVDGAAIVDDADQLKTILDDITAGLPQLDDQPISDLEKRIPELEALLERVEKSDGGAA